MPNSKLPQWATDEINSRNAYRPQASPSPSPSPEGWSAWLGLDKAANRLSDWWSGSPDDSQSKDPNVRDWENSIRQRRK